MNKAEVKTQRIIKALNHEEPDQVPVTDFFWSGFIKKWQKIKELDTNANIYDYYDLDLVVVNPNMDPVPNPPEIIEDSEEQIIYKSGWGSKVMIKKENPMPGYLEHSINNKDDYDKYEFHDPADDVRYDEIRGDLINMGDSFNPEIPSLTDQIESLKNNFCLFGGVCEPNEVLTRARGQEGTFLDLAMYPEKVKKFAERSTDFMIEIGKEQLRRYECLTGMVIWGDIAYDKGMFYSPDLWREIFKPSVARLCEELKNAKEGLKLIYHGCGDARAVFDDLIDVGIDCYNPLEVKAGLDVVELKNKYKDKLACHGGIDVRTLADKTKTDVKDEIMRKLNAAKGGGYIVSSDHSVATNVKIENYDYMVKIIRENGKYPLDLGKYDETI